MNIPSSIARLQRGTAFLLALGVAAGSSGAWLLYTAPGGATAQALARFDAEAGPLARARTPPFVAAMRVAMRDDGAGFSMQRDRAPGDADFVVSVEVRAQISGRVAAVRFEPGSYVEKGETLFVLDAEPFVAAVQHAQSTVASARARLAAATAELGRAQRAFDEGTIGHAQLDACVRAQREAHGTLRAAAMVLEGARRDLGLTRIVAPIDGRVAAVQVNVGDRVAPAPGGRALVTIVSSEPVYAGSERDANAIVRLARAE
ncbi:MAG TPA: efflux RND transporter periplasmic adaptor subunit [Zeimonas sp.]